MSEHGPQSSPFGERLETQLYPFLEVMRPFITLINSFSCDLEEYGCQVGKVSCGHIGAVGRESPSRIEAGV